MAFSKASASAKASATRGRRDEVGSSSGQWAVGRGQSAFARLRRDEVGSWQGAVGSGQWAVGSGQWAFAKATAGRSRQWQKAVCLPQVRVLTERAASREPCERNLCLSVSICGLLNKRALRAESVFISVHKPPVNLRRCTVCGSKTSEPCERYKRSSASDTYRTICGSRSCEPCERPNVFANPPQAVKRSLIGMRSVTPSLVLRPSFGGTRSSFVLAMTSGVPPRAMRAASV